MKILVIAAHPDDEILGMGGTLKKLSKKHRIKIVFMATGIFARRSTTYKNVTKYEVEKKTKKHIENQIQNLRCDAKNACKIVGVTDVEFIDFPDNEMDLVSNLQITKKIEERIEEFNPKTIFTHSPHDINIDHRLIYNATLTATRPISNHNIEKVISFEVPSSTEWNFPSSFSPNIFINVEKELQYKLRAMKAYKDELREFPHPRSVAALEAIAKRWGSVSGFKAAEAFCLVRQLSS